MPLPNTNNTEVNSRSRNRQGPSDGVDSHAEHFLTLRKLFRSKSSYHSKTEPKREQHRSHGHSRRNAQTSSVSQSNHHHDKTQRSKSLHAPVRKAEPGTRGLYSPAYGHLERFSQHRRQRNPIVTPRTNSKKRSKNSSQVIVQFFNCEDLSIGENFLVAPNLERLDSAAVAFLGQCQLKSVPETSVSRTPNPAYRGLSLQGSHGGYHLHFPDCAGMNAYRTNISDDWNTIMKLHAHTSPNSVLLVGVGLGPPGRHCL